MFWRAGARKRPWVYIYCYQHHMAVSFSPSPDGGAKMNLKEVIQELHSELEKWEQSYGDLKEKFLRWKSTAYALAKELQKYQCEEDNDLIVSVLGEEMQSSDRELAERLTLTQNLSLNSELQDEKENDPLPDKVFSTQWSS